MNQKSLFEIKKFKAPPTLFTDRNKISDFEKTIDNLPKNSRIIIREYDLKKEEREEFAKKIYYLAKIKNRSKNLKILVGKNFDLARKIKADGVHFSDFDDLSSIVFKRKSFAKKFIFSLACHSLDSILQVKNLKPNIIFISPIFATTSHVGTKTITLRNLKKITSFKKVLSYCAQKPNTELCALGGINSNNIRSIRKLGITSFGAINFFNI